MDDDSCIVFYSIKLIRTIKEYEISTKNGQESPTIQPEHRAMSEYLKVTHNLIIPYVLPATTKHSFVLSLPLFLHTIEHSIVLCFFLCIQPNNLSMFPSCCIVYRK